MMSFPSEPDFPEWWDNSDEYDEEDLTLTTEDIADIQKSLDEIKAGHVYTLEKVEKE